MTSTDAVAINNARRAALAAADEQIAHLRETVTLLALVQEQASAGDDVFRTEAAMYPAAREVVHG